ncbi:hypothetical protein PV327_003577 [Microctonus hyperodae]|uniref:SAM domain-containing protein n=1 Tax=Microctonus hyperodae TaxID=165561 RepID=A0AA39L165_MICHY|nr:hypothetical protein PV327_003577 [Microctonus hyperodae]
MDSSCTTKTLLISSDENYDSDDSFPLSSTLRSENDECDEYNNLNNSLDSNNNLDPATSTPHRKFELQVPKYTKRKPSNLMIREMNDKNNYNKRNTYVITCSPVRSPLPELDDTMDFDNSCIDLDATLEPPHFETPPKGFELGKREKNMIYLLKRYGLAHFAFIFIEQEVDIDLFLTLTDSDLREIGITRKNDRNMLLSMIDEFNNRY